MKTQGMFCAALLMAAALGGCSNPAAGDQITLSMEPLLTASPDSENFFVHVLATPTDRLATPGYCVEVTTVFGTLNDGAGDTGTGGMRYCPDPHYCRQRIKDRDPTNWRVLYKVGCRLDSIVARMYQSGDCTAPRMPPFFDLASATAAVQAPTSMSGACASDMAPSTDAGPGSDLLSVDLGARD